jgi:hypothetical protein
LGNLNTLLTKNRKVNEISGTKAAHITVKKMVTSDAFFKIATLHC